ncbi:MAG: hypothetical protein M1819_002044 [Sarea resinae]|nr:MAG: hypothetical protein M1819_002044 [Sarea resinae]
MSGLVSSFFIEPVLRTARRISSSTAPTPARHSDSPEGSLSTATTHASLSSSHDASVTIPGPDGFTSTHPQTETEAGQEVEEVDIEHDQIHSVDRAPLLSLWTRIPSTAILDQPIVSSPTTAENNVGLHVSSAENDDLSSSPHEAPQHLVPCQTDGREVNDETSNNPFYGIPEQFRSTTTSVHSTASFVDAIMSSPERSRRGTGPDATGSNTGSYHSQTGSASLPADDGMGTMRKRIAEIRDMEASSAAKARLVHGLMTEQYLSSQPALHTIVHDPRAHSPLSFLSHDGPCTPTSTHSVPNYGHDALTPTSISSDVETGDPYHLTPEDLKPTYVSKHLHSATTSSSGADSDEQADGDEDGRSHLGCPHYKRNVKLQCSVCSRWYTCRFCHDEVEDHSLNRRETKHMLCDSYNTAQIQILGGPDQESIDDLSSPEAAQVPAETTDSVANSGPPSRGRALRPAAEIDDPIRSTTIASASYPNQSMLPPYAVPERTGRSLSPTRHIGEDVSNLGPDPGILAPEENGDGEEEEEELEFWGGDGPSERFMADLMSIGEDEDDEEDDEDDEDMDDEGDGDDDEDDGMELFGHR